MYGTSGDDKNVSNSSWKLLEQICWEAVAQKQQDLTQKCQKLVRPQKNRQKTEELLRKTRKST